MFINEPLIVDPLFMEKIWGGDRLRTKLNKPAPADKPIGESWEICGFEKVSSVVKNGSFAGSSLYELFRGNYTDLIGSFNGHDLFPLLVKFIDAQDNLSVQVHPDDNQVKSKNWGHNGKTESWYIVDAQPDCKIISGFKYNVSISEVKQAIENQTLYELLNYIPVKPDDVLFIPAGTVHAILNDTLIYEIQQSSDTTLRMYDWGRTDSSGKSRKLHIEDALEVMNTEAQKDLKIKPIAIEKESGVKHSYRSACNYFALEQYNFYQHSTIDLEPKQSFRIITTLNQPAQLLYNNGCISLEIGQTVFVPACMNNLKLSGTEGTNILQTTIPDLKEEIINPLLKKGIDSESIALLGDSSKGNDLIQHMT